MSAAWVARFAAGSAIVALLLGFAVLLIPHYARNYEFKQLLNGIARGEAAASDESVRLAISEQAAKLGIRVYTDQIRLQRSGRRLRIDVPYVVPVNLPLYSVDLHFQPSAQN